MPAMRWTGLGVGAGLLMALGLAVAIRPDPAPATANAAPRSQGESPGQTTRIDWVGEHFGSVSDVAADGEHLYAAMGTRLHVLAANFEAAARPLATLRLGVGWIGELAATGDGHLVVVAGGEGGRSELLVLDLAEPLAPVVVARNAIAGYSRSSGARLIAHGERAWIASSQDVRAYDLSGPEGARETARWTVPVSRYGSAAWMDFGLLGDFLVGAMQQRDPGTPGPVPTPCRGSSPPCPTPRPYPLYRQRLWVLDARPEAALAPVGRPLVLPGESAEVSIGATRIATTDSEADEVALWTLSPVGELVREQALSSTWLIEQGIGRPSALHVAAAAQGVWLIDGGRWHHVQLGSEAPRLLGSVTGPSLGVPRPFIAGAPRLVPAADGGLILVNDRLHRAPIDAQGRLQPVAVPGIATGRVLGVAADTRGAWAVVGPHELLESRVWRVRAERGLRQEVDERLQANELVQRTLVSDGERLYIADRAGLVVWHDAGGDAVPVRRVMDAAWGDLVGLTELVAGTPGEGLLARIGGTWQWLALENEQVVPRALFAVAGDSLAALAGGVPWVVGQREDGSRALVAGELVEGMLRPRWPGRTLTRAPSAMAGRGPHLVTIHFTGGTTVRAHLTTFGWDADLQPRGSGEIEMGEASPFPAVRLPAAAVALDAAVAWVLARHPQSNAQVVIAVDVSLPHAPREIARLELPGIDAEAPLFAVAGGRAWIGGGEGGALRELRLLRAATPTPDGPTRRPPTPRPPTATREATGTPAALMLPWLISDRTG